MIRIWLTGRAGENDFALIDDDDVSRVTEYPWHLHKHGYATATVNGKSTSLHRFITGAVSGQTVDHKNRNKLDNQKSNLRFCSTSQNASNSAPRFGRKYKGVYEEKNKKFKKFHAHARIMGKSHSFGRYYTAEEAALAYDEGIKKLRGEFAYLNFPEIV